LSTSLAFIELDPKGGENKREWTNQLVKNDRIEWRQQRHNMDAVVTAATVLAVNGEVRTATCYLYSHKLVVGMVVRR
jgi:hypothetical protein